MTDIPEMTDPLGKYWHQPKDIREAPMDDKLVLLTPRQFDGLNEYSTSLPSGVYPGKCWKRIELNRDRSVHRTMLVWYGDETPQRTCPILFRDLEVVT